MEWRLSETSPVTHANPIRGLRKAGSIGLPLSDVEMKIMDVETGEKSCRPARSVSCASKAPT